MKNGVKKYAKDFKCNCGKKAVCFVGLNDPDGTQFPKCRKCADEWKFGLMIELSKIDFNENQKTKIINGLAKNKKRKSKGV